ncbi:uncharacterized protein F5891DRAFT_1192199 [Suillus fuscotomentosus]|uniref:Chromo domain-containing protein n=1 Tax=Suillus fuscotomentosus TaxID=1912939 RepID=A0AAD4HIZ9_9AGAM|nr:uncharacterized protein F5891DRAFT_1192199 [Suillus fuscotomentosus]KAG1897254.1 hypothetical protein F5891DRAFT_1192199 [Suillus fuscotomentosus]
MRQCGIHDVFHSSYLRIHLPNDNRLFPGRLDNQVAEFKEEEQEWAVDRILSHKGTRSDAVFEVRWKSGDVTWLPYDQVDHLAMLQEYFDVLDIEHVSELTEGNGLPPTDNPQVFLGHLGLGLDYITPTSPSNSSTTPQLQCSSQRQPSTMSNPNPAPLFRTLGNGRFAMPDRYRPGVTLLLTLDQIKLYLQHDADLRGGIEPTTIPSPISYDELAVALNSNAENGIQVALVLEDNTGVHIKGRLPTLAELVGLDATRRVVTTQRDPREEAGGKWLDSRCTELMDEALWDNLDRLHKQRKWREKGVAERQAKRQHQEDEEAFRPFAPSRTTNHAVAGPSNTTHSRAPSPFLNNPVPPPPDSSAPKQPAPPNDEDAEMMDGEATEAAKEAACAKAKGHIPKK